MTLKTYINGELVSDKVFDSIIKNNSGKFYITKNADFSGKLSNIKYFETSLNKKQIKFHYSQKFSELIKTQDFLSIMMLLIKQIIIIIIKKV